MVTISKRMLWLIGGIVAVVIVGLVVALTSTSSDNSGSSGGSSGFSGFDTTPTTIQGDKITDSDTQRWMSVWCDLTIGLTRDQVYQQMGSPTHESLQPQSSAQPAQSEWASGAFDFTVFFYLDGTASEYYINSYSVDPSIKSQLSCPLDRQ